jgi:hypothetical protein
MKRLGIYFYVISHISKVKKGVSFGIATIVFLIFNTVTTNPFFFSKLNHFFILNIGENMDV